MAERAKRRRLKSSGNGDSISTGQSDTLSQDHNWVTNDDKRKWKGFCEIESEPAFFNAMLKDFGVQGVKVQEIISLDEDMLATLPQPVYGLIFLFKWREEDSNKQEQSCPKEVWFANQTVNNACASVALLNIVNNISGLEIGEALQQFKDFTADFTPALRGDAIGNFEHVKDIHNSFARKMDILNADLQLKNDATYRKKGKRSVANEDEAGFHFIAFVPIEGTVWKLDGLERQPQRLDKEYSSPESWTTLAAPEIQSRMAEYEEDQIEFAVLSLVKDPLLNLSSDLAAIFKSVSATVSRLDDISPSWMDELSTSPEHETLKKGLAARPAAEDELDRVSIEQASIFNETQEALQTRDTANLIAELQRLFECQSRLLWSIKDERDANRVEEERAASRRNDEGQLAKGLIEVIGRMGKMEMFLEKQPC